MRNRHPLQDDLEKIAENRAKLQRMMAVRADTPTFLAVAFPCPHCQVNSQHKWFKVDGTCLGTSELVTFIKTMISVCLACGESSIWVDEKVIFPWSSSAPMPVEDMPNDVKLDYLEARSVFEKSSRSAGGLLRIALEKLLKHLGATKSNPNDAIGELVLKGVALGPVQQAMDSLRIFANQTVHDGFVKLEDQPEVVFQLFSLMNYIVEQAITQPNKIKSIYGKIPLSKADAIEKRDKKKP